VAACVLCRLSRGRAVNAAAMEMRRLVAKKDSKAVQEVMIA